MLVQHGGEGVESSSGKSSPLGIGFKRCKVERNFSSGEESSQRHIKFCIILLIKLIKLKATGVGREALEFMAARSVQFHLIISHNSKSK